MNHMLGLTNDQTARIEKDFAAVPGMGWREELSLLMEHCTEEEQICLKFLYAYMPVSDLATYEGEFYLKVVRDTLHAREMLPWGVEGELFLNYVLPVRLNNENLTDHRERFFGELYPRVKGLPLKDAILEVNYWCFENATYHSTDDRTCSPLGVLLNAAGRCGEESVLCVSALRSVGIPARQCYTPRWAHCDDNHAWVEVWAEDGWHCIGACEPEPVLDRGWFVETSMRGMLVHARAFTNLISEPEVTNHTSVMAQVNILNHYAPVKRLEVTVTRKGRPVEGAEVQFQLINYAQLYPLASIKTDKDGKAHLMTGFGDLYIQVIHEGKFLCHKAGKECTELHFAMEHSVDYETGSEELELVPPVPGTPAEPHITPEMAAVHEKRLAFANASRKAIEEGFLHGEKAEEEAKAFSQYHEEIAGFLTLANGNWREILSFLHSGGDALLKEKVQLLGSLRKKDFSDSTAEILESHLQGALPYEGQYPEKIFVSAILCPRVDFEMIVPYREAVSNCFTEEEKGAFRKDPKEVFAYISREIADCGDRDYATISASPAGLLKLGVGSALSRKILFVALCRSIGIPARLCPVDKTPEYWDGEWRKAADLPSREAFGELVLCKADPEDAFVYEKNFTVARLQHGIYENLFLDGISFEGNEVSYRLEAGRYRVMTSNRMPDGSVLAELTHVELRDGSRTKCELHLRRPEQSGEHSVCLPEIPVLLKDGEKTSVSRILPRDVPCAAAFIETGKEPTEHLLNEILEQPEEFAAFRDRMVLLCKTPDDYKNPLLQSACRASGIRTVLSAEGIGKVLEALGSENRKLPLVMGINAEGCCVHHCSGYNVGTGDWLLKHFRSN